MVIESQSPPGDSSSGPEQTHGPDRSPAAYGRTATDSLGAPAWLGDDRVILLRAWATETYYALPDPHIAECVIGSGPSVGLRLGDPGGLVSRKHARLVSIGGGFWEIEDLDSKNGIVLDGERRPKFVIVPGAEIGIGDLTLVAENQTLVRLRQYLARVLGWEPAQRPSIDLAMRAIRAAATQRAPLSLAGTDDLVAVARQIHRCTTKAGSPFVVCGRGSRVADASVRVTSTQTEQPAALELAAGGTVCVRAENLPAGFEWLVNASREPRARTQLVICANTTSKHSSVAPPLIVVPPLTHRAASDIERIVAEYAVDAIGELGAAPESFTEANRAWVTRHAASSFAEVEIATLRIVALNDAGNVYQAAARLGLSHVALGDWFKRRRITS